MPREQGLTRPAFVKYLLQKTHGQDEMLKPRQIGAPFWLTCAILAHSGRGFTSVNLPVILASRLRLVSCDNFTPNGTGNALKVDIPNYHHPI